MDRDGERGSEAGVPAPAGVWWRNLVAEGAWGEALRALQRQLRELTGCRHGILWVPIPPSGRWLRITGDPEDPPLSLSPECHPLSLVDAATGCRAYTADRVAGPFRDLLGRAGIAEGWLIPLAPSGPASREGPRAVLDLGWTGPAPPAPPAVEGLAAVAGYLVGQRLEELFIDALVESLGSQGPPTVPEEWAEPMALLTTWLDGDGWALYRAAEDADGGRNLILVAEYAAAAGTWPWVRFAHEHPEVLPESALDQAARQQRVVRVADTQTPGPRVPGVLPQDPSGPSWLRSLLVMPLGHLPGRGHGLLLVSWERPAGWERLGLSIRPWEAVRRLCAGFWQNMLSTRDASRDPLTGLRNRRGIAQAWNREVSRRGEGGTLGMVDLDRFGEVNNRWGHLMGDQVLRAFGRILEAVAQREGGWCGRWGGDEFVVGLPPDVPWDEVGRRLQTALDGEARAEGWPERVTVSGGAVRWRAGEGDWAAVLDRADRLLYRAKRAGRARFLSEGASTPSPP